MSYEDYMNNAYHYSNLAEYFRNNELSEYDQYEIKDLAQLFRRKEYKILLFTEYDDGANSPYVLNTFQAFSISSEVGKLESLGKGSLQYNDQLSYSEILKYAIEIFLITFVAQPILRFTRVITVPDS